MLVNILGFIYFPGAEVVSIYLLLLFTVFFGSFNLNCFFKALSVEHSLSLVYSSVKIESWAESYASRAAPVSPEKGFISMDILLLEE